MRAAPFLLDQARRRIVLAAIRETCTVRGWWRPAAHIRSTHVHAIVATEDEPERVLIDLKSYASRALVKSGLETSDRPKWAKHGSTRWLWEEDELHRAIDYVLNGQGADMEVHRCLEPWK
jgi:REP element-mobilizing transposase RayT